ncbi:hypothetical protein HKD37_02G004775 [Glycine soja]
MWSHLSGNSLSVSMRHSHLEKLDIKCRGHSVVHRSPPPQPESQGSSKLSDMPPSTSISPHENYKYLLTKFILFPCSMKYET